MDFQMNLFDLFATEETTKEETTAEVKAVEPKAGVSVEKLNNEANVANETPVRATSEVKEMTPAAEQSISTTPSGIPFQENLFNDDEDDDSDDATSSDDDEKAAAKKAPAKKGSTKKVDFIPGPVNVVGFGWSLTYGEAGTNYKPADVCKAVYEMGYKEIVDAEVKYKDSTLYVATVSKSASSDDEAMGDEITIGLGNFNFRLTADMFIGMDPKEISIFDAMLYFVKQNPDFKGCGLKAHYGAKFAVPTFTKKVTPAKTKTYRVWSENSITEVSGETLAGNVCYQSDTGVVFAMPEAPKSAQNVYGLKLADDVKSKKATELYHLPFTLWIETYGQNKPCTSADFGGKDAVGKEDVIDYLKGAYRVFRSQTRKFSVSYDRTASIVGVAVISGEKGVL